MLCHFHLKSDDVDLGSFKLKAALLTPAPCNCNVHTNVGFSCSFVYELGAHTGQTDGQEP